VPRINFRKDSMAEQHLHSPVPSGRTPFTAMQPFDKAKLRGTAQPGRIAQDPKNIDPIQTNTGRGGSNYAGGTYGRKTSSSRSASPAAGRRS
jgi:hypothetical protein